MNEGQDPLYSVRMRAFRDDRHLAGGEDIVPADEVADRVAELLERGLFPTTRGLDAGTQPSITFRIDPVDPRTILPAPLLPVHCLSTGTVSDTWGFVRHALAVLDAGGNRLNHGALFDRCRSLLSGARPVSPGAFLLSPKGEPVETEDRGVRVTHFGIVRRIRDEMSSRAEVHGIGISRRFVEALQIASKALHSSRVLLEFCLSDNPDYTTGYLAVRNVGYIRLPQAKPPGIPSGGRLYVVDREGDAGLPGLLDFLTRTPVLFTEPSPVFPASAPQPLLDRIVAARTIDG